MGSVRSALKLCALFSLSLLLLFAAGLGCSAGRNAGEACAQTADCRAELACLGGTCGTPSGCPAEAPIDCGAIIPDGCCPMDTPVCCATDNSCYSTVAECPTGCLGEWSNCKTSADCCTGLACHRGVAFCKPASNLDIGDTCTASAQCAAGLICDKTCTKACNGSDQCGLGVCLVTSKGLRCVATCDDDKDCAGTGLSCRSSTDPTGMIAKGCF